jgi:hypothetical protein
VEQVFGGCRRESTLDRVPREPGEAGRGAGVERLPPAARRVPVRARRPARIASAPLELWAMSDNGAAPRLAPSTAQALDWLRGQVLPGHVIADLTAGSGLFALAAARRFGCTVLALESNLAALSELWENTLINACDGLVVPLPFKVGPRAALRMERFDRFAADAARSTPRLTTWREHDPVAGPEVLQPAIAVPLGWALDRWKLPVPRALRARLAGDAAEIIAAVTDVASAAALQAVVLEGDADRLADATTSLGRVGFVAVPEAAAGRTDVLGYNRAAPA